MKTTFLKLVFLYMCFLYTLESMKKKRAENTMDKLHWNLGTNPVN